MIIDMLISSLIPAAKFTAIFVLLFFVSTPGKLRNLAALLFVTGLTGLVVQDFLGLNAANIPLMKVLYITTVLIPFWGIALLIIASLFKRASRAKIVRIMTNPTAVKIGKGLVELTSIIAKAVFYIVGFVLVANAGKVNRRSTNWANPASPSSLEDDYDRLKNESGSFGYYDLKGNYRTDYDN